MSIRPPADRLRPRLRDKRGQSLVEMTVLIPILLLMVLGSVDLGRIYFSNVSITNASREGAHELALTSENYTSTTTMADAVNTRVLAEMGNVAGVGTTDPLTSVIRTSVLTATDRVTVTVNYTFTLLFLAPVTEFVSGWWGGPKLNRQTAISQTTSFPVITGLLIPTCTGGSVTASPSSILATQFASTTISTSFGRSASTAGTFDATGINVYWDTKDGSSPGQTLASNQFGNYSFAGSVINPTPVPGSHYVYAVQPATSRCAAAVITVICAKQSYYLGNITLPPLTGIYFNFTSAYSVGSIDGNGTFPSTTPYSTTVDVYYGYPFGNDSGLVTIPASDRASAVNANRLLNAAVDQTAASRTASYNIPGTAYAGGQFTVAYFNMHPGSSVTITSASAAACDIVYNGPAGTATPTLTPTPTYTPVPTSTPVPSSTSTSTPGPTATPTETGTPTPIPTSTGTNTPGPSPTPTNTTPPTATPTVTNTPLPTATPTVTSTPLPTDTPTVTPTPTQTPTPTPTPTPACISTFQIIAATVPLGTAGTRTNGYGYTYNLGAGSVTVTASGSSSLEIHILQGTPAGSTGAQSTVPSTFGSADKAQATGASASVTYNVPVGSEGNYTIYFYDGNNGNRDATNARITGCLR